MDPALSVTDLARVDDNAPVLADLRSRAVRRNARNGSPWDVDDYELHTHPDMTERLETLVAAVPGLRLVPLVGYVGVVAGERIVAVGEGTSRLALRLVREDAPPEAEASAHPSFGAGWSAVDIWLTDLPTPRGLEILTDLFRRAVGSGGSAGPGSDVVGDA